MNPDILLNKHCMGHCKLMVNMSLVWLQGGFFYKNHPQMGGRLFLNLMAERNWPRGYCLHDLNIRSCLAFQTIRNILFVQHSYITCATVQCTFQHIVLLRHLRGMLCKNHYFIYHNSKHKLLTHTWKTYLNKKWKQKQL